MMTFNHGRLANTNTIFGIGAGMLLIFAGSLPAYAGAQSLLDPYADVRPAVKSEARTLLKRSGKEKNNAAIKSASGDLGNSPLSETSNTLANESRNEALKKKPDQSNSFASGVKEIQHGYITAIKAAGSGIFAGTRSASSKMASGSKVIGEKMAIVTHKVGRHNGGSSKNVATKGSQNNSSKIAYANGGLTADSNFSKLPGKPLDQAVAQKNAMRKWKDSPVTEQAQKPSLMASTWNKINFFHKDKKKVAPGLTASNSSMLAQ